jgi:hypothetical protein
MATTIKLYCKEGNKKKDGTAPIYVSIRLNKKVHLIPTEKYINPIYFDNEAGKVQKGEGNAMKLNSILSNKLNQVIDIV